MAYISLIGILTRMTARPIITLPIIPHFHYRFSVVLNYLRLRQSKQMWETCLPKDPDRLALLTQEAEYYRLPLLRDQGIALLQVCTEKGGMNGDPYVNEVFRQGVALVLTGTIPKFLYRSCQKPHLVHKDSTSKC